MCADGASTTTKIVPTYVGEYILAAYVDLVKIFSNAKVETLPQHWSTDHESDLDPRYTLPYGRIYNQLEFMLMTFKAHIEASQPNMFLQWSLVLVAALILIPTKNDGG
jgi:hypothetical protein